MTIEALVAAVFGLILYDDDDDLAVNVSAVGKLQPPAYSLGRPRRNEFWLSCNLRSFFGA
jgi:hypothetical protein